MKWRGVVSEKKEKRKTHTCLLPRASALNETLWKTCLPTDLRLYEDTGSRSSSSDYPSGSPYTVTVGSSTSFPHSDTNDTPSPKGPFSESVGPSRESTSRTPSTVPVPSLPSPDLLGRSRKGPRQKRSETVKLRSRVLRG